MPYDLLQLHQELKAAVGDALEGVDSNGRISWRTQPTAQQTAAAEAVLLLHDPQKRKREQAAERAAIKAALVKLEDPNTTAAEWRFQVTKAIKYLLRESARG